MDVQRPDSLHSDDRHAVNLFLGLVNVQEVKEALILQGIQHMAPSSFQSPVKQRCHKFCHDSKTIILLEESTCYLTPV